METKKGNWIPSEKGKDLCCYSEKGNFDPIKTLGISIPNVSQQDQIKEGYHLEEEAAARLEENSMAETYS